jgi:predicted DNA-binding protein YlxM (UPF0122 family)
MLDETTLRQLYLEQKLSIRSIAAREQVSVRAVYDALLHYNIPRRPAISPGASGHKESAVLEEASMRHLYLEKKLSVRVIAERAHVSTRTVYDALVRYRIPRRTPGYRSPAPVIIHTEDGLLEANALRRLYIEERQSIAEIANAIKSTQSRVRRALLRSGVVLRRRGPQRT